MLLGQPDGILRDKLFRQTKQAWSQVRYHEAHLASVGFVSITEGLLSLLHSSPFLQVLALSAEDLHECSQRSAAATLAGGHSVPCHDCTC